MTDRRPLAGARAWVLAALSVAITACAPGVVHLEDVRFGPVRAASTHTVTWGTGRITTDITLSTEAGPDPCTPLSPDELALNRRVLDLALTELQPERCDDYRALFEDMDKAWPFVGPNAVLTASSSVSDDEQAPELSATVYFQERSPHMAAVDLLDDCPGDFLDLFDVFTAAYLAAGTPWDVTITSGSLTTDGDVVRLDLETATAHLHGDDEEHDLTAHGTARVCPPTGVDTDGP